jgi:pantoate--beta-alanine ligase
VQDLNIDVGVSIQQTIREPDGLAMSSRNVYLDPDQRRAAPAIFQALVAAQSTYQEWVKLHLERKTLRSGSETGLPGDELRRVIEDRLSAEPLVSSIHYVAIDDKNTLQPLSTVSAESGALISLACQIGSVRLIDNIVL